MSSFSIQIIETKKCFDGELIRFRHNSISTKVDMIASIYIPAKVFSKINKLPCLVYLSGLTCTDENVCQKSGIFNILSELGICLIAPDTSPRNAGVKGETDSWDFGVGAGFYLDATEEPWSNNYRMYAYIVEELLPVVSENFPKVDTSNVSITGHSMGGKSDLIN